MGLDGVGANETIGHARPMSRSPLLVVIHSDCFASGIQKKDGWKAIHRVFSNEIIVLLFELLRLRDGPRVIQLEEDDVLRCPLLKDRCGKDFVIEHVAVHAPVTSREVGKNGLASFGRELERLRVGGKPTIADGLGGHNRREGDNKRSNGFDGI